MNRLITEQTMNRWFYNQNPNLNRLVYDRGTPLHLKLTSNEARPSLNYERYGTDETDANIIWEQEMTVENATTTEQEHDEHQEQEVLTQIQHQADEDEVVRELPDIDFINVEFV